MDGSDLFGAEKLSDWHYAELYQRAITILNVPRKGTVLPAANIRIARGISHSWFWEACWNAPTAGGGCPFHGSQRDTKEEAIAAGIAWIREKIPHMTKQDAERVRIELDKLK